MVSILIVDRHPIVRLGIVAVLSGVVADLEFIEAAATAEALDIIASQEVSLALIDFPGGDADVLDLLMRISATNPALPVLIFSSHPESASAASALGSQLMGHVSKESVPEILIAAVRQALTARNPVAPGEADRLTPAVIADPCIPLHDLLSDREYEVMLRISTGVSVNRVAEALHLSPKTVSTYRMRILGKMRVKTNAELTRYAIINNLIEQ